MLKSTNNKKTLIEIEKKVSWLSNYIIHYANNIRVKKDDLKVGGHQASSASVVSILVVLFFKILKKYDRIAIKPHASPVFHAIQYLLGNQNVDNLKRFRKLDGAQAYPSKTKDFCDVDFSTGSVGLGGAMTIFSSFTQDFLKENNLLESAPNKMISIFGDAELDEGNVYEALLEGAKHNLKNCWWIIDYNRQSLDGIVYEKLFEKIINLFELMDWNVEILKYGSMLQKLKQSKSGRKILKWIDDCPNDLFSALTYQGGKDWRKTLLDFFSNDQDTLNLIQSYNDQELNGLMTNLAGHDMESLETTFSKYINSDKPTCFICYTVKGFGLPLAGHKDNHSGIMNNNQFNDYKKLMKIREGHEWDKTAGIELNINELNSIIKSNPLSKCNREFSEVIPIKPLKEISYNKFISTQEAFGKIMNELGKVKNSFTNRIITTSPDVTVSTSLGGWVNKKNIFSTHKKTDIFGEKKVFSSQKWKYVPDGQHIELGIAENNLFLLLASLGISEKLFGKRILPVGTIYDTFIGRGLDALNYATYIDARFILVGTPSGVTLSHEGGAHQSILTPNIGISQPNLKYYEPSYADELEYLFFWGLEYMQKKEGSSVYFRLSTKKLMQPQRILSQKNKQDIVKGCYWLDKPETSQPIILICTGVMIGEVEKLKQEIAKEEIDIGVLVATSPDNLYSDWMDSKGNNTSSHIEQTLELYNRSTAIITVIDGHSSSLAWIGSVLGHKVYPMGLNKFGQSGDLDEIYNYTNIDFKSIIDRIAKSIINS